MPRGERLASLGGLDVQRHRVRFRTNSRIRPQIRVNLIRVNLIRVNLIRVNLIGRI